jgi:hypothetical protein
MERNTKIILGLAAIGTAFFIIVDWRKGIRQAVKTAAGAVGLTRGLRNNNPFNIRKTDIDWQGEIEGFDKDFESFKTLDDGIRAGLKLLKNSYLAKGFDTPAKILNKYAPSIENDTQSYIKHVTDYLTTVSTGTVGPNTVLKANLIPYLGNIIMKVENGVWVSDINHIKEIYSKI